MPALCLISKLLSLHKQRIVLDALPSSLSPLTIETHLACPIDDN